MSINKAAWVLAVTLALSQSAIFTIASAQDNYPSAPVRLIVGFAAGATTDVNARLLAQKLSAQMNASVVVEDRVGANGNIAAEFVSKSKPDGYTLLFNTVTMVLSPALGEKLGYDLFKDLVPVSLVGASPLLITTSSALPVNTMAEFINYAKANPGKLTYGSAGVGSPSHLGALMFLQEYGLSALHVPYKGAGPALVDLVAGRIEFSMQGQTQQLQSMVKEKGLKTLAITSLRRSPLSPTVPALAETLPGFEVVTWLGVMAPANTPSALVRRLNGEITKALQDPDLRSRMTQEGADPKSSTPEEYSAYIRSEMQRWTKVIKAAGVMAEQ